MGYKKKEERECMLGEPDVLGYTASKKRKRNRVTQQQEYDVEELRREFEESEREIEALLKLYREGIPGARERLLSTLEERISRDSTPEGIRRGLILSAAQLKAGEYLTAEEAAEETRRFMGWQK